MGVATGVVGIVGSDNRKSVAIVIALLCHCEYSYNWSLTKAHETLREHVVPSGTRSNLQAIKYDWPQRSFCFVLFCFLAHYSFSLHVFSSNTYTSIISITEAISYPGIYSRKHLDHIKMQMFLRENKHTSITAMFVHPFIFSLYVNDLEEELCLNGFNGLTINHLKMFLLFYDDDIVILAETARDLQLGLDRLLIYCHTCKWKLKVNKEKN